MEDREKAAAGRDAGRAQGGCAEQFQRTRRLIGAEALGRLQAAGVLVFGIGGVGGFVCEALVRAGVGRLHMVDKDRVDITNLNRQVVATYDTVGMAKVEAAKERFLAINPELEVTASRCFYLPERAGDFDFSAYDYVVDAVDNVTAKLDIICRAKTAGVPVISSMGTGNKLNPTAFKVADIAETKVCPLAKVIRRELAKRGVKGVKVVYSEEEPRRQALGAAEPGDRGVLGDGSESVESAPNTESVPSGEGSRSAKNAESVESVESAGNAAGGRVPPASISFVPSVAGLIIAGEVIKDLTGL